MKYWCYNEFGPTEADCRVVVLSEDEIIQSYYPYWSGKMIQKFGQQEFEKNWCQRDCIDDWVVVHWAWESE